MRFSVVVCTYSDERVEDLHAALDSLRLQSEPAGEIVVVVDHNPGLLERVRSGQPDVVAVENSGPRGLSGARNSGIAAASHELIAFLDDDAVAAPDWLARLEAGYSDPAVIAVGGRVDPLFDAGRPAAFPPEFDWVIGCSHSGMPSSPSPVRNLVGANMSFRAEALARAGAFRSEVGRIGKIPVGCEETELCIRALREHPGSVVLYDPAAAVGHRVPAERTTAAYFRSRCLAEGRSKAVVSRLAGSRSGLSSERAYTLRTLPAGIARGLGDALRGDGAGLSRAWKICEGFALTVAGYVRGRIALALGRPPGPPVATELDVHGLAGVRIEPGTPAEPQLRDMFAPFVGGPLERTSLVVSAKRSGAPGSVEVGPPRVEVSREAGILRVAGRGELLVHVLPLVDILSVEEGAGMVHAAAVARAGRGVLMAGPGGVGKTSAVARLLEDGFGFMGDDWGFLSREGRLLGYAKPIFVRPHHRAIMPHLFGERRKPLVPPRLTDAVGAVATLVHPVVSRFPAGARVLRRWSPEHMIVPPAEAFPHAEIVSEAALAAALWLVPGEGPEPVRRAIGPAELAPLLVENFEEELSRPSRALLAALGAGGLADLAGLRARKEANLRSALEGVQGVLLEVPKGLPAEQSSAIIAAEVLRVLEENGSVAEGVAGA